MGRPKAKGSTNAVSVEGSGHSATDSNSAEEEEEEEQEQEQQQERRQRRRRERQRAMDQSLLQAVARTLGPSPRPVGLHSSESDPSRGEYHHAESSLGRD